MAKILVSDPISKEGVEILKQVGQVDVKTGMSKEELIACIGEYDALAVRSETKVTADVLAAATNLKIIGRAGVGVDNIEVPVASERGIIVVNSPEGNTMAAAEHTVAMLLALSRNISQANASLKDGKWERSKYMGVEVYNKALGVIGLGKIGREVAKRMQSFGMDVIAYDPFLSDESAAALGIEKVGLDALFSRSDYITLHLPKTKDTEKMLNDAAFAKMKNGVRIINVARGGIVDEAALLRAIESGKVAGAALDVFEVEKDPAAIKLLVDCEKIVTTPHLGASTEEAQEKVAVDIAEQIVDVLQGRPARSAVNMPAVAPEVLAAVEPYLKLMERMGSLLSQTMDGALESLEITYSGELTTFDVSTLTRAALVGIFKPILAEAVNYVNAPIIAKNRGVQISESKSPEPVDYTSLISLNAKTDKGKREVCGTLFGKRDIRIVRLDGYDVDMVPEGYVLVSAHIDRPGVIGRIGTLLGSKGINIAGMHVGRKKPGARAIMVLTVDSEIPKDVMAEIAKVDGIEHAVLVRL